MSAYEELHAEIKLLISSGIEAGVSKGDLASAAIMKIKQKLETVTPEMEEAWLNTTDSDDFRPERGDAARGDWLAMLRASPLTPP